MYKKGRKMSNAININILPTEILQIIFNYLRGSDLLQCSSVCSKWDGIVASFSQDFWLKECIQDFSDIYEESYRKAELSWRELYRSLSKWSEIGKAVIEISHINVGSLESYNLLKNNVLCFSTSSSGSCIESNKDMIVYYNLKAQNLIKKKRMPPNVVFQKYYEDDNLFIFYTESSKLTIIPKRNQKKFLQINNVSSTWLVKNGKIYFQIDEGDFGYNTSLNCIQLIFQGDEVDLQQMVLTDDISGYFLDVSYKDGELYVFMSLDCDLLQISKIKDGQVDNVRRIQGPVRDVIPCINKFGFCWSNTRIFDSLLKKYDYNITIKRYNVNTVFSYGQYLITGSKEPLVIHIFNKPFGTEGELILHRKKPIKTINLEEFKIDDPVLFMIDFSKYVGHINNIDVVETENGHKLIVVFCKRLFIIDLKNRD